MHVRARVLPEITNVRSATWDWVTVMAPPLAVKGPTVAGWLGMSRVTPVEGGGSGSGSLNAMLGLAIVAGVAPVTSTVV